MANKVMNLLADMAAGLQESAIEGNLSKVLIANWTPSSPLKTLEDWELGDEASGIAVAEDGSRWEFRFGLEPDSPVLLEEIL